MSQTSTPATVTLAFAVDVPDRLLPDPADPIQLPKVIWEWPADLIDHITEAVAAQLAALDDPATYIDTVTIDDTPAGL